MILIYQLYILERTWITQYIILDFVQVSPISYDLFHHRTQHRHSQQYLSIFKALSFLLQQKFNHMDPELPKPQKNQSKFQKLQSYIPPEMKILWEKEQAKIRQKIKEYDDHNFTLQTLKYIGGVDLSANKDQPDFACAALVIYNIQDNIVEYEDYEIIQISQPYIPGFLAFREVPPLFQLFQRLKKSRPQVWPELLIIDGNGILHQNKCGLACHLGVLIDTPTIGCGKTLFYIDGLGKDQVKKLCEQGIKKQNDYVFLKGDSGKIWGAGLRNGKNATNPVFVSIGTKVSLQTAIKCVIMSSKHRVPEPVRLADKLSREIIEKANLQNGGHKFPKYEMVYLDNQK